MKASAALPAPNRAKQNSRPLPLSAALWCSTSRRWEQSRSDNQPLSVQRTVRELMRILACGAGIWLWQSSSVLVPMVVPRGWATLGTSLKIAHPTGVSSACSTLSAKRGARAAHACACENTYTLIIRQHSIPPLALFPRHPVVTTIVCW